MIDPTPCELGHAAKAMECPSCSGSTDVNWWKWYKTRTSSAAVKALVVAYLADRAAVDQTGAE